MESDTDADSNSSACGRRGEEDVVPLTQLSQELNDARTTGTARRGARTTPMTTTAPMTAPAPSPGVGGDDELMEDADRDKEEIAETPAVRGRFPPLEEEDGSTCEIMSCVESVR